ncbi:MAG TPA: TIGR04149 family rSAM-modified RiPP [Williamwhitmania sp.]|nr:TIGR04149 family rSAM-modified RiPP [Williamwhitmania sp.]
MKKIKLNKLAKQSLKTKEMNAVKGGTSPAVDLTDCLCYFMGGNDGAQMYSNAGSKVVHPQP